MKAIPCAHEQDKRTEATAYLSTECCNCGQEFREEIDLSKKQAEIDRLQKRVDELEVELLAKGTEIESFRRVVARLIKGVHEES